MPQTMQQKTLTLRFNTPAFLGNAEQNGQWRTPPFKALLRQWWRVAVAANYEYDHQKIRHAEALLFGHAWLKDDVNAQGRPVAARKSQVRLRLDHWNQGKDRKWSFEGEIFHPEVGENGRKVGADLYLGYGPLSYDKNTRGTKLKANAAIQADETTGFRLAFPQKDQTILLDALALMNAFGAVGGRSRNGWGSFMIEGVETANNLLPLRDWEDCLSCDWVHAIGQDSKALIWRTAIFNNWQVLMTELAKIKIDLRTQFAFKAGKTQNPEDRHWLSYPVTHHSVGSWDRNGRLPNTLRFKVRRDDKGKFYGIVFHMPCQPPAEFSSSRTTLVQIWQRVHAYLDRHSLLTRNQS